MAPSKKALGLLLPVLHLVPDQIACLAAAGIRPAPSCHHTETQTRTNPRAQTHCQSTWLWCSSARSGMCARIPMSKKRHRGSYKEQVEQARGMGLDRACSLCAERGRMTTTGPGCPLSSSVCQTGRLADGQGGKRREQGMRACGQVSATAGLSILIRGGLFSGDREPM